MTGDKYPSAASFNTQAVHHSGNDKNRFSLNDLGEYEELYDPFSDAFTTSNLQETLDDDNESEESPEEQYELIEETDELPATISREKEVSICIKLENAELDVMHRILASPFGIVQFLNLAEEVRTHKLLLQDILRDYHVEYAEKDSKKVEKSFFDFVANVRKTQLQLLEINQQCHNAAGNDAATFKSLLAQRNACSKSLNSLMGRISLARKQCHVLYEHLKDLYKQLEEARNIIASQERLTGAGFREIERISSAIQNGELPANISHNMTAQSLNYVSINETIQNAIEVIKSIEIRFHGSAESLISLYDSLGTPLRALRQAKDELFAANQRLVVNIAQKYTDLNIDLQDVIQEGGFGLLKAIDRFEYRRKNRFATYAIWWIRQAITRAISEYSRTVRLPNHADAQLRQLAKHAVDLNAELGRRPTLEELSASANIPVKSIEQLLPFLNAPESLDDIISNENNSYQTSAHDYDYEDGIDHTIRLKSEMNATLVDFTTNSDGYYTTDAELTIADTLMDPQNATPLEELIKRELITQIDKAESNLTEREKTVLNLRYGLEDNPTYKLEEIGKMFNLTRERIRQIEESAIHKLQHPARLGLLRSYHEDP